MTEILGNIITSPHAKPFYGRIVVEKGKISAVQPLTGPHLLASSCYICPGFIDAHTHPLELGLQQLFVNLSECLSVDEVLERIRNYLHLRSDAEAILGFNLEPEQLADKRYPSLSELDLVSPEVPVLLYRTDGHSAVINSPGLRLAFKNTDPTGLGKNASGQPSGVLRGAAYEHASRVFKARLEPATIMQALDMAGQAAVRAGVTTLAAMIGSDQLASADWLFLMRCLANLPVRAIPFLQTQKPELAKRFRLPRIGGCLLIDGSFGSHTAALTEPYSDFPENYGVCYFQDKELLALLKKADSLGLQTAFHAIGDRAIEQLACAHETAPTNCILRHRIEHAELLPASSSLIDRIAALGLVLCVQPSFEARWGGPNRLYAKRLGERWKDTNPYRTLLAAGVVLAGGSDAPVTPIDPVAGIRAAINHPNPEQRLPATDALALFTSGAAFSLSLESLVGRIEPGMEADLTVLDSDPRNPHSCQVLATYRAGRLIFSATPYAERKCYVGE